MRIYLHKLYKKDKWFSFMIFPFIAVDANFLHDRTMWNIDIGIWLWNIEISWRWN